MPTRRDLLAGLGGLAVLGGCFAREHDDAAPSMGVPGGGDRIEPSDLLVIASNDEVVVDLHFEESYDGIEWHSGGELTIENGAELALHSV